MVVFLLEKVELRKMLEHGPSKSLGSMTLDIREIEMSFLNLSAILAVQDIRIRRDTV